MRDANSRLSGAAEESSPSHRMIHSQLADADYHLGGVVSGSVDRILYNDLVEMIPLVQSLIDTKAKSSFTRRGSVTYTKTPSRELLSRKTVESKGRYTSHPATKIKKEREKGVGDAAYDCQNSNDLPIYSTKASAVDVITESEILALREQVEDLQRQLLEKDELLKSAEASKRKLETINDKLEELKHQAVEKDAFINSTQKLLSDAKIKLADKTAALEKIQWELMTTKQRSDQLQGELDSTESNISYVMTFLDGLAKNQPGKSEDYDIKPLYLPSYVDSMDDAKMQQLEDARKAYLAAVVAAKDAQEEGSILAAAQARHHLQSLLTAAFDEEDA